MSWPDYRISRISVVSKSVFPVTVDFHESLEEMIAAGQYDYCNHNTTAENFPVTGNGQVECEVVLVNFDRDIKSEAAITELEKMGLAPARIEHLLALGARYPDLQREFPIICLGSSWVDPDDGRRYVPCLYWDARRSLYLAWFVYEWPRRFRFAAVRPPSPKAADSSNSEQAG